MPYSPGRVGVVQLPLTVRTDLANRVMTKKIPVNGIEISVAEDDLDKICGLLEEKGLQVDDLEGWQTKATHEPYDFNKFIEKAKEYSDKNPPDVVQFSEKAWGAAAICVKEFYLKRFGILIKSHSARSNLLAAICDGLSGKQSKQVMLAWSKAEKSHSNFYEMKLVTKEDREVLLESIKEMATIIEQADVDAIRIELSSLKSVTLRNIQKEACKIGKNSYDYNLVAF